MKLNLPIDGCRSIAGIVTPHLDDLDKRWPSVSNFLKLLSFLDPESIPLDIITRGAESLYKSIKKANATTPVEEPVQVPVAPVAPKTKSFLKRIIFADPPSASLQVPTPPSIPVEQKPVDLFVSPPSRELKQLVHLLLSITERTDAITQLEKRGLIQRHQKNHVFFLRLHDLNHIIIREIAKEKKATWVFEAAVRIVCRSFLSIPNPTSNEHWDRCEDIIPHLRLWNAQKLDLSPRGRILLMRTNGQIAEYLRIRARYDEAETLYNRVRTFSLEHYGPKHDITLTVMHNLAVVFDAQGRYQEAKELYEEILADRKKELGDDHPNTLATTFRLAFAHQRFGDFDEAERLYKEVLAREDENLGANVANVLSSNQELANVYVYQFRYAEAQELYKHILDNLAPDDPHRFSVMRSLAHVYISRVNNDESRNRPNDPNNHTSKYRERLPDAEALFKQILENRTQSLGPDHLETIRIKFDLAQLHRTQQKYEQAVKLLEEVLEGRRKKLGPGHPETVGTLATLASVHTSKGEHGAAKELLVQVLASTEKTYGPTNRRTRFSKYDLAKSHRELGEYDIAAKLMKEVHDGDIEQHGLMHREVVSSMHQLAKVYKLQGKEDAEALYQRADEIAKAIGAPEASTVGAGVILDCGDD